MKKSNGVIVLFLTVFGFMVLNSPNVVASDIVSNEAVSWISDETMLSNLGISRNEEGYEFGGISYLYCYTVDGSMPGSDEAVTLWLLANDQNIAFDNAANQLLNQENTDFSFRVFYVETKTEKEQEMEKWVLPIGSIRWGMEQAEVELCANTNPSDDPDELLLESLYEIYRQEMKVTLQFQQDVGLCEIDGTYTVQEYGELAKTITNLFGEPVSEGENENYKLWVWQSRPVAAYYSEDYVCDRYESIINSEEYSSFDSLIQVVMVSSLASITVHETNDGIGGFQMKYSMWQFMESE